jgi:signal transduction histidine kinase
VEQFLDDHLPRMNLARVQKELQPDLLWIGNQDGTSVFESSLLIPYAQDRPGGLPHLRLWTAGTAQQPLRLLSIGYAVNRQQYRLLLGSDLSGSFSVVHRFGLLLLLTSPIVMAAAATAGRWTAGRALAPVLAMMTAARNIDATDLSRRIELPQSHDELRFLAETLNGMLARIESGFRKTIEFTANASHELRTPLAVIRSTAEVAPMRDSGEALDAPNPDRTALRQILLEAERNTALLEDLLRLARADSGTACLRMKPLNAADSLLRLRELRAVGREARHRSSLCVTRRDGVGHRR